MIQQETYMYYLAYVVSVALLGVAFIRLQSLQKTLITTKEFKAFQHNFLLGYVPLLLVELLYLAFFLYVLLSNGMELSAAAKLFVVSQLATTATNFLTDIMDPVSRKTKCMLAAMLYGLGAISLTSTNLELLLIGGILRGAGSSLLHSAFEVYLINEHAMNGFPDDWLLQTFSSMGNHLGVCAVGCGVIGAIACGMFGHNGPSIIQLALACYSMLHIYSSWTPDTFVPRYTLGSLLSASTSMLRAIPRAKAMKATFVIQMTFEASVILLTFYWAPWFFLTALNHSPPYGIIFSTCTVAATTGSFAFQALAGGRPAEQTLRWLLIVSTGVFLMGAIITQASAALVCCIIIQICQGMYWPCIGELRGKYVSTEFRSPFLLIGRIGSVTIVAVLLLVAMHSPLLILTSCATLSGLSVYYHAQLDSTPASAESLLDDYSL